MKPASVLAAATLALAATPGMAHADLLNLSAVWPAKAGYSPTYCPGARTTQVTVQGPGKLNIKITLKPYVSAGKAAYMPVVVEPTPRFAYHLPNWSKYRQGGREVRNWQEGVPLETEQELTIAREKHVIRVTMGPPCQSFGMAGFKQYGQEQHIAMTFTPAGAAPAPVTEKPSTTTQPTTSAPKASQVLFNNGNAGAVQNQPTRATVFALRGPTRIAKITTYHYNGGRGAPGGTIALRSASGQVYGPWRVGVVQGMYWVATPNVTVPAGTYTVIDSDPATWAQNGASGGAGMAWLDGYGE